MSSLVGVVTYNDFDGPETIENVKYAEYHGSWLCVTHKSDGVTEYTKIPKGRVIRVDNVGGIDVQ